MTAVRVVRDGINIRSSATLTAASLNAVGRSGRLRRYSDGADLGPTRGLFHSGGHVSGDRHGIGTAPDQWDRMWIGGAWRFAACPLTEWQPDHVRLAEIIGTRYRQRTLDDKLAAHCAVRAREISVLFSHTRPDGSHWSSGLTGGAGEVIAWNGGRIDGVERLVTQWQNSTGHDAILARSTYPFIGTGIYTINGRVYGVAILSTRAQP